MLKPVVIGGVVAAGLLATSGSARSLFPTLNLSVNPVSATSFEVIEARGAGAMDMWCAAASYAEDTLGVRGNKRLYVESPRGPSVTAQGRKGVVFTTNGAGGGQQAVSVSVRRAGDSLPIHHARQFCLNHIIEPADRF